MRAVSSLVIASLFFVSCGGVDSNGNGANNTPTPTPSGTPTSTPTPTATPTPQQNALRIIALGDTGTGSSDQYLVAAGVAAKCAASGCDFGFLLGDNFYNTGVTGPDDVQFEDKFQGPYGELGFPFYVVLGNHDYGGDGAGYEFDKGAHYLAYAQAHDNFILPAEYYSFEEGPATILAPGTNLVFWDRDGAIGVQGDYYKTVLDGSSRPWRIVFGHHPYLSNGKHGNAGEYDGVPWLPIANGANVKKLFDDYLCGRVDLYVSGHDHSRQVLPGTTSCPATFVVSGAGAKVTELPGTNPNLWQANTLGFTYLVITDEKITIEMLDPAGNVEFSHEILAQ